MADSSCSRMLNPLVFHLQKLGLELKCPSCLELYTKPILLPCNHIFCGSCVPDQGSDCAICKRSFIKNDIREAPFMESIVNIYRSMDMTFSPRMHQMAFVKGNSSPLPSHSQTTLKQDGDAEAMDMDVFQLNQLSQGSPPGSGDDSLERHPVKKSNKRLADEFTSNEVHSSTDPLADNSMNIAKKPKQKINGEGEVLDLNSPQMVKSLKENVDCGDKLKSETMVSSDTQAIHPSDSMDSLAFACEFCQTRKVTEHTGPMMHYANGNPVVGKEATRHDVIHVHSRCIEWAPQIYYVDESVKNLNKELQRGAKLKCCKCKLKGAALGCYAKSCKRTFHVPCAAEISECRWDTVDFLMLCPTHASQKFPCEKSRKRRSEKHSSETLDAKLNIPAQKERENINFSADSSSEARNWVFCASSLSSDEKHMLLEFASMCGATVLRNWSPAVTHVLAATDEIGACSRSQKVLMAILEGKWVLSIDWVKACIEMKGLVDEEPYEISIDTNGCRDGPRTGRLMVINKAPKLFSGVNFYLTGQFVSAYMEVIQELIIAAGGNLVESKQQLLQQDEDASTRLIIYNCDSENDSEVLQRQLEAEVLAAETGSQAIPHTWVLTSIASCRLLPVVAQ